MKTFSPSSPAWVFITSPYHWHAESSSFKPPSLINTKTSRSTPLPSIHLGILSLWWIKGTKLKDVATFMCSWSWAWCCRVSFSCCFWNSAISNCFWICCCCWIKSSSCCSCFSRIIGSTMGTIILRSVRKSNGVIGSNPTGTSDFTSTVQEQQQQKGK